MPEGRSTDITTYQAGAMQATVHRSLQRLCDVILEPFHITKAQWLIIGFVLDAGERGVRISDLARSLSTTIPYITNATSLLEGRGYLRRKNNSRDSRSKLLMVSPQFVPRCAEIERVLQQGLHQALYAAIEPADFDIYLKVLSRLDEAARQTPGVNG